VGRLSVGLLFTQAGYGSGFIFFLDAILDRDNKPAIGNGTVTGIYTQVNKLVVAQVSYYFGSTTTYGTGTYGFSAPVTAASHSAWANIGFGRAYDASTSTTYFVVAFWDAFSTSTIRLQSTTGGQLGQTAPVTWANGDEIHFSITYEAA